MEKATHRVNLELPTDDEAVAWLSGLVDQAQISAAQASNILAIKAWLGQLPGRLDEPGKVPLKAVPDAE